MKARIITATLLSLALIFSLVGCTTNGDSSTTTPSEPSSTAPAATPTPSEAPATPSPTPAATPEPTAEPIAFDGTEYYGWWQVVDGAELPFSMFNIYEGPDGTAEVEGYGFDGSVVERGELTAPEADDPEGIHAVAGLGEFGGIGMTIMEVPDGSIRMFVEPMGEWDMEDFTEYLYLGMDMPVNDVTVLTTEEQTEILTTVLGSLMDGKVVSYIGDEEIQESLFATYVFGIDHETRIESEGVYAVSPAGDVFYKDGPDDPEWLQYIPDHSDILLVALGDQAEGKTLLFNDPVLLHNEMCASFSLGTDTPEKFTAERHFAVNNRGVIYEYDVLTDTWYDFIYG